MTPNDVLRETRSEAGKTLGEMAEALDTSNQRVSQWEHGDPVPLERIRAWANEKRFPVWVRVMAHQMWQAHLEQAHDELGRQIEELRTTVVRRQ